MEGPADVSSLSCLLMNFTLKPNLFDKIFHFIGRLTGSFHIKILTELHLTVSGQDM